MKELPILFSAPMVLALLAGTKTQTRRIMKPQPSQSFLPDGPPCNYSRTIIDRKTGEEFPDPVVRFGVADENEDYPCKLGRPGDRLWVKETCAAYERPENGEDGVVYSADGLFRIIENTEAAGLAWHKLFTIYGKRGAKAPSIFMPRWASRITLEITDVRAERLNAISEGDACDEGIEIPDDHDYVGAYRRLWETINGPGSWEANPWVWVVSFRRVEP